MNPPIFTGAKTSEDPEEFIDEVHKILVAMGTIDIEKAELASYKLKDVAQTCRDEMSILLTGIAEDLDEECREAMLHDIMVSRLMVHVHQVEENRKRKHTRVGNKSRQAEENFSGKSSTEIRDKPRFKKGLFHQGESSSSKGLHNRNSESRVKRNNEVDTPQERPPCRKCGKLHGGECMRGTNAFYSCGKPGNMVKDCLIRRSQEQGKDRYEVRLPTRKALVPYLFVFVSIG
nr:uncharacterized protein LOC112940876 [Solanum lycopersicum]